MTLGTLGLLLPGMRRRRELDSNQNGCLSRQRASSTKLWHEVREAIRTGENQTSLLVRGVLQDVWSFLDVSHLLFLPSASSHKAPVLRET